MTVAAMIEIEEEACKTLAEEPESPPVAPMVSPSHVDRNAAIGLRAYALWEASGRVAGQDLEFWLRAENELFESGDVPTA